MAEFIYRARDEKGRPVKGSMSSASKEELIHKLKAMGYMITAVDSSEDQSAIASVVKMIKRINSRDLIIFYFQLANMIEAGISILAALKEIELQTENRRLRNAIIDGWKMVESGSSLSEGLSRHRGIFSAIFINMLKAGEESGKLSQVLRRYARYSEHQEELREKIKGALFYPLILLAASVIVILFIVSFIIPQFADMFSRSGIGLPLITRFIFTLGLAIKQYWHIILLLSFAMVFLLGKYISGKSGRMKFDRFILKLPLMGGLTRKVCVSRFARTLETLLSSGLDILRSLDIIKEVIGNAVISAAIANVRKAVEEGSRVSEPLRLSGEFPSDAVAMISIGEETGNIEAMLAKIADFYDMSVGFTIKRLTVVIEPLFLTIMGIIVAFIMASILMPILDMAKMLR